MRCFYKVIAALAVLLTAGRMSHAQTAGTTGPNDLVIKADTAATVVVAPDAGKWEKKAAEDLAKYVGVMTGGKLTVAESAAGGAGPVFVVGREALKQDPTLAQALAKVAKKNPVLRADAIVMRRNGNKVLLAGTNDDSHYYAVAQLLRDWGCRWFMPTDFGESIPHYPELRVGQLDYAYGSPFEVRRYWISWVGDYNGRDEFMRRNFFNDEIVPSGHNLAQYTKELIPPGKSMFNIPISEPKTAEHVAKQLEPAFAKGERIMLGMEDGIYESDSASDKELQAGRWDKYFMVPALTDPFMAFYNNVARSLLKKYPQSNAKIGFLAYSNITLPPSKGFVAEKPLVAYLAPIDIDPIHGMDDPKSPPEREYKDIMYGWARAMQGRVVIYDYDQGMLVWRDIPNPSMHTIRDNYKHYRDAGILGVDTESRNAIGTIFLNLYLRGQLGWNPDADADALNTDFYPRFYGPAGKPMADYWTAINNAWRDTIITEHENFVAPGIYTPELIAKLKSSLEAAEGIMENANAKRGLLPADWAKFQERMKFTRLSYNITDSYMTMVRAAAAEGDYAKAVAAGERGLAAREEMTKMNGIFTTYKGMGENGPAWWPGEVQQYRELLEFTNGTKGTLVKWTPLEWAYRRDPKNDAANEKWATGPIDLNYWNALPNKGTIESHLKNPGNWEMLRTDLYVQAQGVLAADGQSFTGANWYRTDLDLTPDQVGDKVHIRFPGLFNEAWLYVNGERLAHREQNKIWWYNDYKFEWDVDLSGKLKAGKNTIALRTNNPHHFGGMFRRPFLYRAK